jgi:hypothetical protein
MKILDSGFRRNDEKKAFGTFYEIIIFSLSMNSRSIKYSAAKHFAPVSCCKKNAINAFCNFMGPII